MKPYFKNPSRNETLRLAPATPSGSQRVLPKGSTCNGGIMIGDVLVFPEKTSFDNLLRWFRWIPEGTSVQIHTYTSK